MDHRLIAARAFGLRVVFGLLLLVAAGPGHAQFAAPYPPTIQFPVNGTVEGRAGGGTPITMTWTQRFVSGTTLRSNPTQFLVCVQTYEGAVTPPACSRTNASWVESIATPSSRLQRSGNNFFFMADRRYADEELDRQVRLSVVACTDLYQCSSAAVGVWHSTRNIVAGKVDDGNETDLDWIIDVRADNPGTTSIGQYSGDVSYWEVLGEGSPGQRCRVDVDDPQLRIDGTLWVIDAYGNTTPMLQVSRNGNGVYVGAPVAGIYRTGDAYEQRVFTTLSTSLGAGTSDRGVGQVRFAIPSANNTRTFVMLARHDRAQQIREYNESDNRKARCILR